MSTPEGFYKHWSRHKSFACEYCIYMYRIQMQGTLEQKRRYILVAGAREKLVRAPALMLHLGVDNRNVMGGPGMAGGFRPESWRSIRPNYNIAYQLKLEREKLERGGKGSSQAPSPYHSPRASSSALNSRRNQASPRLQRTIPSLGTERGLSPPSSPPSTPRGSEKLRLALHTPSKNHLGRLSWEKLSVVLSAAPSTPSRSLEVSPRRFNLSQTPRNDLNTISSTSYSSASSSRVPRTPQGGSSVLLGALGIAEDTAVRHSRHTALRVCEYLRGRDPCVYDFVAPLRFAAPLLTHA